MIHTKSNIKIIFFIALLHSLLLTACGGGSEGEEFQISEIIIFVPDGHRAPLVDQTFQLGAVGIYSAVSNNEELTLKSTWTTSDPKIATVSNSGEVNTLTIGEVIITATYGEISHAVKLTVSLPPSIKSMSFLTTENTLTIDTSLLLSVESTLTNDETSVDSNLYNWTTDDENNEIATIDETGNVTAISPGEIVITVTAKDNENISAEKTLVIKAKLVSISQKDEITYIEIGAEEERLVVFENLSDGSSNPIAVNWSYDTEAIIRIDGTKVSTINLGTVNTTANYEGFEISHKFIVEGPIQLFILEDTGGFIKLAWHAKQNAANYTLYWNNGGENEEDKVVQFDADVLEYTQGNIDSTKPYYYRLSFTRNLESPISFQQAPDESSTSNNITWDANCDATEYTLTYNIDDTPSTQTEIKITAPEITDCEAPPKIEYLHENYDSSKSYNYQLTYAFLADESKKSKEIQVWTHIGEWSFRDVISPRNFSAGASVQENMYFFGGEITLPENQGTSIIDETWKYNILKNKWTKVDSLQTPIKNATACSYNEFIYIIGGQNTSGYVNDIHVFDTITGKLTSTITLLPASLSNSACNIIDNMMYITGGYNGTNAVDSTFSYDITNDIWNVEPTLITARYNHSSTILDGNIYIAGGTTSSNNIATGQVEIFDPTEIIPAWAGLQAMNPPRSSFALHTWGGLIHAIGGISNENSLIDNMSTYDPSNEKWLSSSTMPFPNAAFNSTQFNNSIYIWGGTKNTQDASHEYSDYMNYSINDGSWLHGTNPDAARENFSTAMIGKKLYLIGGKDKISSTSDIRAYDTQNNSWEKNLNSLITPRHTATSVIYNINASPKIFTFGGINGSTPLKSAEMYDVALNVVIQIESMELNRTFAASAILDSKIYVFGGNSIESRESFEVFNIKENEWKKLYLPNKRSHATAVTLNDKIYLIGGLVGDQNNRKVSNTVDIYTPATNSWVEGSTLNIARSSPGSTVLNGIIYIFGGTKNDKNITSSVEKLIPFTQNPDAKPAWSEISNLPRPSLTATGGSFENKIYLISEEIKDINQRSNNIFVLE